MTQQSRVPRPDEDGKLILRYFAEFGGDISCGGCSRCNGELFVDKHSLVNIGVGISIECNDCPREAIMSRSEFLEQARANLADHHYNKQLGGKQ